MTESAPILCFRCNYDLRGVADDQPCPECGLLAGRSRRPTDALRDARPAWLRRLSIGVWLVLLTILMAIGWPYLMEWVWRQVYRLGDPVLLGLLLNWFPVLWIGGWVAASILFWIGAFCLTCREGYEPADRADRDQRLRLRIVAGLPLAAVLLAVWISNYADRLDIDSGSIDRAIAILILVFCMLPVMLFLRLRNLAKRAGSAHLAEHCLIVGVGTSLTFLVCAGLLGLESYGDQYLGLDIGSQSSFPMAILMLLVAVFILLFWLWSMYLLIRFAIAFWLAANESKWMWRAADRAAS